MIVRKTLNAAELFWSSLDEDERMVVVYGLVWVVVSALAVAGRASRDRLRRDIIEELTYGDRNQA